MAPGRQSRLQSPSKWSPPSRVLQPPHPSAFASLAIVAICIIRLSAFALNALFVFNRGFRFIGIRVCLQLPANRLFSSQLYSMKFKQRGKLTDISTDTFTDKWKWHNLPAAAVPICVCRSTDCCHFSASLCSTIVWHLNMQIVRSKVSPRRWCHMSKHKLYTRYIDKCSAFGISVKLLPVGSGQVWAASQFCLEAYELRFVSYVWLTKLLCAIMSRIQSINAWAGWLVWYPSVGQFKVFAFVVRHLHSLCHMAWKLRQTKGNSNEKTNRNIPLECGVMLRKEIQRTSKSSWAALRYAIKSKCNAKCYYVYAMCACVRLCASACVCWCMCVGVANVMFVFKSCSLLASPSYPLMFFRWREARPRLLKCHWLQLRSIALRPRCDLMIIRLASG